MTAIFWILLLVSLTMYLEGLAVATFVGAISQTPKWAWPLLLLFWPIALPVLAYKADKKYRPMIQQVMQNPLLGSLMGFNTQPNPLASLLGNTEPTLLFPSEETSPPPNPFLGDLYTEAQPSGELAELIRLAQQAQETETQETETQETETQETTKPESTDSDKNQGD